MLRAKKRECVVTAAFRMHELKYRRRCHCRRRLLEIVYAVHNEAREKNIVFSVNFSRINSSIKRVQEK